ncbi:MAG TPA: LuxR C-terminal-related transcriptional regulator [Anaerolineales bacterium]|nr:LuxR C-terminal-related transcriptional regulator [Anaerolineales bacterium]
MSYNGFMPTPILATKLFIPPLRTNIVPRPHLTERMKEGKFHKLTLISAPAGFGKTTLVSEWITGCGLPVAWLSLDEGDNDHKRFLAYLIAALRTITKNIGERASDLLDAAPFPDIESVLTSLLNEITATSDHFILVLDDYHLIESKQVDEAVSFLVEHLPPQIHLVIATREDPPLPLPRLRVRGQLTELRAADLRFTPTEAADFLNRVMGLNLSAENITALETRTEGWIAGLQLAALSMQGHQDTASFIKSFTGSHRFVLDYLIEEVFQQQPERVQAFLLHTSILERMCGSLCDAILRDSSVPAQETLEHLEHANLFIVPLDSERRWYRYHHLFGDLLRQRAGKNLSQAEIVELHIRASEWYEQNEVLLDAFHHALAAGDFDRAARLAETAWQGMERNFQTLAWLGWVKKLPDAVIGSRPWLCVHIGWAYSDVGELEPSETYLQKAERSLTDMKDWEEFKSIPSTIALIRSGNAQIEGNLPETVRYAELCLQLAPEDSLLIHAQAAITLGFTQWAVGDVEASLQAMLTWMDDMQKLGNQMYAIASAFVVADMQMTLGHLSEAENILQQMIQQAAIYGQDAINVTAHHHLGLAMLAHEYGDDAAVASRLQLVAELGQRSTLIDWAHRWGLAQARLKESAGEWDEALKFLDEAQRGYVKNPIPTLQPIEARKARIYLKQGRPDMAQAWAQARSLSVRDEASYFGEYEHLTLARIHLAERSFEGVNPLLERLLALAESQKRTGSMMEILILQSLAHQTQGEQTQALTALERALTLTEPAGYIRIFVDEGEPMRLLLEEYLSNRESSYVERLLEIFSKPQNPKSQIVNRQSKIVDPLSERELEVLKLLRSELSGPEIAERLIVSLNTLRTHTKNIFNKLGVNNRRSAIRRAEELDLL